MIDEEQCGSGLGDYTISNIITETATDHKRAAWQ